MRYDKKYAKAGESAIRRALLLQETAPSNPPTAASDGVDCKGYSKTAIMLLSETGTNAEITAWIYESNSEMWTVATDFGTSGTLTAVTATNNGMAFDVASILGGDRLFLQVHAVNGAGEKISAWASLLNENLSES